MSFLLKVLWLIEFVEDKTWDRGQNVLLMKHFGTRQRNPSCGLEALTVELRQMSVRSVERTTR